jgi:heme a synthase
MIMETDRQRRLSPWPHRLAIALALVTFPLIWVGGLVTTYDAGMAVPDWPGTYGYNLFLYPWQTWLAAPWDLFIEHGHRLLGALAGLLAIALVASVLFTDRRRWLIWAALGALGLVIIQGILGGARVLFDARLVALIHGCIGPLFFAYLAGLIVATSQEALGPESLRSSADRRIVNAAWLVAALAYLQLVVGAVVRHVPLAASPQVFRAALVLHLVGAVVLAVQVARASWLTWSSSNTGLRLSAALLPLILTFQVLLGVVTYVAKYSWPAWLGEWQFAAAHVVQERSFTQSFVTTAHVAGGSLILFVAVVLAARSSRFFFAKVDRVSSSAMTFARRRSAWREVTA